MFRLLILLLLLVGSQTLPQGGLIRRVAVVGERHSGTNFLFQLLLSNLDTTVHNVSETFTQFKHKVRGVHTQGGQAAGGELLSGVVCGVGWPAGAWAWCGGQVPRAVTPAPPPSLLSNYYFPYALCSTSSPLRE